MTNKKNVSFQHIFYFIFHFASQEHFLKISTSSSSENCSARLRKTSSENVSFNFFLLYIDDKLF